MNYQNSFSQFKSKSWLKFLGVLFLLFAVFAGIFAGLLNQQDLRQRASEGYGNVEIILVPSNTPLQTNTLSTIFVRVDTKGEEIDGIQVVFDLLTQVTSDVTVRVKEGSGLKWAWDKVDGVQGGKRVGFAAITSDPYKPFRSNSPIDVAEISFTAQKPGSLAMVFDGFMTKANKHQLLKNVLKPIIVQEYQVKVAPTPSPVAVSSTNSVSNSVTTKGGQARTSPSPTAVAANVVITSETNGGNSQTLALGQCNDSCTQSSQCGNGLLCDEGRCRLATNLTSVTCQNTQTRNKNCNDVCAQSLDCQVGQTCYNNVCRLTSNPQSPTCQQDTTTATAVKQVCGKACNSNEECGGFLSCYIGQCRLPTNPTNLNCNTDEVITRNLGEQTSSPTPSRLQTEDQQLSLLTKVAIALGATVVVAFIGIVVYSLFSNKNRQRSQNI